MVGGFPEVYLSVAGDRDRPVSLRLPADRFALSLAVEHRIRAWGIRDPVLVGLDNYRKLILGSTQRHFLGRFGGYDLLTLTILTFVIAVLIYLLARYVSNNGLNSSALHCGS